MARVQEFNWDTDPDQILIFDDKTIRIIELDDSVKIVDLVFTTDDDLIEFLNNILKTNPNIEKSIK